MRLRSTSGIGGGFAEAELCAEATPSCGAASPSNATGGVSSTSARSFFVSL
jgi:hypothetical protein